MVANSRWATSDIITASKLNTGIQQWGADADKPSPSLVGQTYLATDTLILYISVNGSTWGTSIVLPTPVTGNNGSYVGDHTVNRAIAHGLGRVPRIIEMTYNNSNKLTILNPGYIGYLDLALEASYAVTAADSIYFYVGNATAYPFSGNGSGNTYVWVAM